MTVITGLGDGVLGCVGARPQVLVRLQGTDYTELPEDLCQGYSDTIFGKTEDHEYGGVICDRAESSYLFLQRFVGYSTQRKAIWKIIHIYPLSVLQDQEFAISTGCEQLHNQTAPIVAIVKTNTQPHFQVIKAWTVDLQQERLNPISPQTVSCSPPFLAQ